MKASVQAAVGLAADAVHSQKEEQDARSLMHRLGDHFSGVVYAGLVMVLGAVFMIKASNIPGLDNESAVTDIVSSILDAFTTGAGLVVLLILAIIFGYALFYMDFASGGNVAGGGKSGRT